VHVVYGAWTDGEVHWFPVSHILLLLSTRNRASDIQPRVITIHKKIKVTSYKNLVNNRGRN